MAERVIGIDAGGTMTKAALFDLAGRELACARSANIMSIPHPGWTERDADGMWRAAATAVRDVLAETGTAPGDVLGISVSGYGSGLYLVDAKGNPVRPGIVSTDGRAAGLIEEWRRGGLLARVEPLISQYVWAGQSLALLGWLLRHEPEVIERTHSISFCKDFLRGRLCGDISTDFTDAGSSGMLSVAEGSWAEEALHILGMEALIPKLPPLGRSDEVVGQIHEEAAALTGLHPGTPVVRGTVDMSASALASALLTPNEMSVVAGTFSIASTLHERSPKRDTTPMLQFPYPLGGYLAVEGSATSASNLEWVCKTLLTHGGALDAAATGDIYEVVNAAIARRGAAVGEALFLPYLFGGPAGAPAGFVGMNAGTDFDEMVQAVFEGIVFAHKGDVDAVLSGPDAARPGLIRLTGGASRSTLWTAMFADILGLPVEVPVGSEFGAKGTAICAAAAVGAHASLTDAVAAMTGIERRDAVNAERGAAHRAKYPRFQAVGAALAAAWSAETQGGVAHA